MDNKLETYNLKKPCKIYIRNKYIIYLLFSSFTSRSRLNFQETKALAPYNPKKYSIKHKKIGSNIVYQCISCRPLSGSIYILPKCPNLTTKTKYKSNVWLKQKTMNFFPPSWESFSFRMLDNLSVLVFQTRMIWFRAFISSLVDKQRAERIFSTNLPVSSTSMSSNESICRSLRKKISSGGHLMTIPKKKHNKLSQTAETNITMITLKIIYKSILSYKKIQPHKFSKLMYSS